MPCSRWWVLPAKMTSMPLTSGADEQGGKP